MKIVQCFLIFLRELYSAGQGPGGSLWCDKQIWPSLTSSEISLEDLAWFFAEFWLQWWISANKLDANLKGWGKFLRTKWSEHSRHTETGKPDGLCPKSRLIGAFCPTSITLLCLNSISQGCLFQNFIGTPKQSYFVEKVCEISLPHFQNTLEFSQTFHTVFPQSHIFHKAHFVEFVFANQTFKLWKFRKYLATSTLWKTPIAKTWEK